MKTLLVNSLCFLTLAASAHVTSTSSRQEEKAACEAAWLKWQRTYGGRTPFVSHNKTHPEWKITQENVESALKGEVPTFQFEGQLRRGGVPQKPDELFRKLRKLKTTPGRQHPSIASSREHIDYLMRSVRKDDELVIVLAGGNHVTDYFLAHPQEDILYVSPKFSSTSMQTNTDYRTNMEAFLRLTGNKISSYETGKNESFVMLADVAKLGPETKLPADFLVKDVEPRLSQNRILIGDLHGMDEASVIEDLPSGACLKALGFSKVTYVGEGAKRKASGYSDEELARLQHLDFKPKQLAAIDRWIKSIESEKPKVTEEKTKAGWKNENSQPALILRNKIAASNPEIYPIQSAMMRKIADFRSGGLNVFLQGLDVSGAELELLSNWNRAKTESYAAKSSGVTLNEGNATKLKKILEILEHKLEERK